MQERLSNDPPRSHHKFTEHNNRNRLRNWCADSATRTPLDNLEQDDLSRSSYQVESIYRTRSLMEARVEKRGRPRSTTIKARPDECSHDSAKRPEHAVRTLFNVFHDYFCLFERIIIFLLFRHPKNYFFFFSAPRPRIKTDSDLSFFYVAWNMLSM